VTSPCRSPLGLATLVASCSQQWAPLIGSGCTAWVRFWCTPTSSHQIRLVSGSNVFQALPCSRMLRRARRPAVLLELGEAVMPGRRCPVLRQAPAPEVVAHRDDAGLDALGDPDLVDEVADLRLDLDEVAGLDAQALGVLRVHPHRVLVADLVQPLGVGAPGVDQRGQAEGRQEQHLALVPDRRCPGGRGSRAATGCTYSRSGQPQSRSVGLNNSSFLEGVLKPCRRPSRRWLAVEARPRPRPRRRPSRRAGSSSRVTSKQPYLRM
jgi:hypothetical protein